MHFPAKCINVALPCWLVQKMFCRHSQKPSERDRSSPAQLQSTLYRNSPSACVQHICVPFNQCFFPGKLLNHRQVSHVGTKIGQTLSLPKFTLCSRNKLPASRHALLLHELQINILYCNAQRSVWTYELQAIEDSALQNFSTLSAKNKFIEILATCYMKTVRLKIRSLQRRSPSTCMAYWNAHTDAMAIRPVTAISYSGRTFSKVIRHMLGLCRCAFSLVANHRLIYQATNPESSAKIHALCHPRNQQASSYLLATVQSRMRTKLWLP